MGKRISARIASGQHSTNKMHQPTNGIRVFILRKLRFIAGTGNWNEEAGFLRLASNGFATAGLSVLLLTNESSLAYRFDPADRKR